MSSINFKKTVSYFSAKSFYTSHSKKARLNFFLAIYKKQLTKACSNATIETIEKGVKYVQS